MGPNYVVGEKVPGTVLIMEVRLKIFPQYLVAIPLVFKAPITPMKFSVSAVVQRAVAPNISAQLKKKPKK